MSGVPVIFLRRPFRKEVRHILHLSTTLGAVSVADIDRRLCLRRSIKRQTEVP